MQYLTPFRIELNLKKQDIPEAYLTSFSMDSKKHLIIGTTQLQKLFT